MLLNDFFANHYLSTSPTDLCCISWLTVISNLIFIAQNYLNLIKNNCNNVFILISVTYL